MPNSTSLQMNIPTPAWLESGDWHVVAAHWAARAYALTAPQISVRGRMALFLASAILWSLAWLLYRAWQVIQTPNDVLVDKLGLDIPPAPEITLEEINDTEVQISWKLPDVPSSIQKHVVHVNGIKVGETKRYETAVTIAQLHPGAFYDLRIFTVSAAGFQTPSYIVHFRTTGCPRKQEKGDAIEQNVTIRINTARNFTLPSPTAPTMAREMSGGPVQARRATVGRKHAPTIVNTDIPAINVDDPSKFGIADEGDDSFAQLSERFQKVQQDNEAAEAQIAEEDKEYETSLRELEARRDELRQGLKERDEASNDLKKQVHKMESANRSAQNEKAKKEKLLQQKEAQRRTKGDEIARWKEQTLGIEEELARIEAEKIAVEENRVKSIDELKAKIDDEQQEVKNLDDSIKDKGSQIKALEEERKQLHAEDENDESREADRLERERDRQWQEKLHNLNATYASLCNALGLAKSQFEAARERLAWCENARRNNPTLAPVPAMDLDLSRRPSKQRRTRHRSSLASNISSPTTQFPTMDSPYSGIAFSQQPIHPSPPFSSGSAFFNMSNGMALGEAPDAGVPTAEDIDILTGGAPMSPRADALIPANLLGDEEPQEGGDEDESFPSSPLTNTKRLSGIGQSTIPEDEVTPASPSPSTISSPSISIVASPRESTQTLDDLQEDESSPHRSSALSPIEASPPEKGQSTSQKLTGLFSFNRQRGKTSIDEPPMLGSLKPGQSQSFPRNLGDSLDPLGAQRRRRLSHTGTWANGVTNLFPRGSTADDKDTSLDRSALSRRMLPSLFSSRLNPTNFGKSSNSGYDPFSASTDPIDPSIFGTLRNGSSSPRPSSTYSFDRLPRPSSDSQPFGWGPPDKAGIRGSPLGPDWSTAMSWSRSQSRRPSFQYGSTSNLSLAPPAEEVDFVEPPREPTRPLQAPIGTRPPSSQRPVTPKLNPTAPSFRTLFRTRDKDKEKVMPRDLDGSSDMPPEPSLDDASPPDSRKSKDARSITTSHSMASTMAESRESLDRTPSGTPSETTPATKESFIQKITRKSSSTKFNSWKDKSGSLFSRKGETSNPGEINEEELPVADQSQLGRSVESGSSLTPSGEKDKEKDKAGRSSLSWNFMRKSKKADKGASEISESSELASETGEESMQGSVHAGDDD